MTRISECENAKKHQKTQFGTFSASKSAYESYFAIYDSYKTQLNQ